VDFSTYRVRIVKGVYVVEVNNVVCPAWRDFLLCLPGTG